MEKVVKDTLFHLHGTPLPLEIRRIETLHEIIIIKLMRKKPR